MTNSTKERVVVVLSTDHPREYLQEQYGDYADMGVFLMQKTDSLERYITSYKVFNCVENDLPTLDYLQQEKIVGIYITGSVFDSFSTEHEWINSLRVLLKEILTSSKHEYPPVFGVCFGHQLIAHCLGVEVKRNPKGLEIGTTAISLTDEISTTVFDNDNKKTLYISEVHNDIVTQLPPGGYQNIGSTDLCEFQGFYKKNKVVSFQGHPEFHKAIMIKDLADSYEKGSITKSVFEFKTRECEELPNEGEYIGSLILRLFKQEI